MTRDGHPLIEKRTDLWKLHPRGDYFLSLGGENIDPPAYCNMVLTNKCNLRCTICGSQQILSKSKTTRSHMPLEVFQAVAETVFPFIPEIELNSQGDPLLYPHIDLVLDTIARHKNELRLQCNGTLFTEAMIERLLEQHGTIYMSIDAIGPLFDKVRVNGVWDKAEPMIRALCSRRDPARLGIRFYPTMTRSTVPDMMNVVAWAHSLDVDCVEFHSYNPIDGGVELEPDPDDVRRQSGAIVDFLAAAGSRLGVLVDGHPLQEPIHRRTLRADPVKARYMNYQPLYPADEGTEYAPIRSLCLAPFRGLDIGLNGQVSVCCRSQDVPLGAATSVESFGEVWFGHNYRVIRDSLTRGSTDAFPLPNCATCVQGFAPRAAVGRAAVRYERGRPDREPALRAGDRAAVVLIFRVGDKGHCFRGRLPHGIDPEAYELLEDGRPLPLPGAERGEIAERGLGRYRIEDGIVYFSSSDNVDPIRNDREYSLRRVASSPSEDRSA